MCAVANSIYYTPHVMVPNCNLTKVSDYVKQKPNQHDGDTSFRGRFSGGVKGSVPPPPSNFFYLYVTATINNMKIISN